MMILVSSIFGRGSGDTAGQDQQCNFSKAIYRGPNKCQDMVDAEKYGSALNIIEHSYFPSVAKRINLLFDQKYSLEFQHLCSEHSKNCQKESTISITASARQNRFKVCTQILSVAGCWPQSGVVAPAVTAGPCPGQQHGARLETVLGPSSLLVRP